MTMLRCPPRALRTERLLLRPTCASDADRAFQILNDWEVARMLRLVPFPPDRHENAKWFADHQREWEAGQACRFSIVDGEKMIGLVDIDGIDRHEGTLGYWLDRAAWGCGYALEAAHAVARFAAEDAGLRKLKASHAHDNPASRRILARLGFVHLDIVERFSRPRNETISQWRYVKAL